MSQNLVSTVSLAGPVRVRAGWDAPLAELFCSVELLVDNNSPSADESELPECFFRTSYGSVQDMVHALSKAGIALPNGMLEAVMHDVTSQAGNVMRDFDSIPPQRIA